MSRDRRGEVKILYKFLLPSSYKGFCRTALTSPDLFYTLSENSLEGTARYIDQLQDPLNAFGLQLKYLLSFWAFFSCPEQLYKSSCWSVGVSVQLKKKSVPTCLVLVSLRQENLDATLLLEVFIQSWITHVSACFLQVQILIRYIF